MKSSCRITKQDIHISRFRCTDCIEDHAGRIRSLCTAYYFHTGTLCPFIELFSGCSAEGICSCNQYAFPLLFVNSCQLTNRRGLADTVHTDYHNYGLLIFKVVCILRNLHLLFNAFL